MTMFEYTIQDELGIHARPAGLLVKAACQFPCSVDIIKGGKKVSLKKLFGLMSLAVKQGEAVQVIAEGEEEEIASSELKTLFEKYL